MRPITALRAGTPIVVAACGVAAVLAWKTPATVPAQAPVAAAPPSAEDIRPGAIREASHIAKPTATLVFEPCVLLVEINGRTVYRGKPRCKNKRRPVELDIPNDRAAHVRMSWDAHYGNGNIWVVHDEPAIWIPLVAGHEYTIGYGYVSLGDEDPSHSPDCVLVTSAHDDYATWSVIHGNTKLGPYATGTAHMTGGGYPHPHFWMPHKTDRERDLSLDYHRMLPGTYRVHVSRAGTVTLSYDPVDRCAQGNAVATNKS